MSAFRDGDLPVDDRRLRVVYEVVACGGIRAAAERLDMDPSAISRSVTRAEERLGVPLFERIGRHLRPTANGLMIFEFVKERRTLQDDLLRRLDDVRGLRTGAVNIAAGEGFLLDLMQGPLGTFHKQHPDIVVRLEAMTVDAMVEGLAEGAFDISLAHNPPPHPAVQSVHKLSLPIDLVTPSTLPFARGRSSARAADLVGLPMGLMKPGYGLSKAVETIEYVERVKFKPNFVTNSLAALRAYVATGLGVTFMPAAIVRDEARRGAVVTLPIDSVVARSAELHLLVRRGRRLPQSGSEALAFLKRYIAKFAVP